MLKLSFGIGVVMAIGMTVAAVDPLPGVRTDFTVHEWGTFTTVGGTDGRAVAWRPLQGPVDLPCFVEHGNVPKLSFGMTVRMETPVIYFYAPRPLTVDVAVDFRQGLMTEFFPQPTSAAAPRPGSPIRRAESRLEWNSVRVMPGADRAFPFDGTSNHYYAARAAEAAPLQVGAQREAFLFYRGVGWFQLPLRATANADRGIDLANDGHDPISALMLFENLTGRIRFQTDWLPGRQITIPRLVRDSSIAEVRTALVRMLLAEGLFTREAEAMVETWKESWFEEGTRVFYVVPKPLVDLILPLRIAPTPARLERVFVGRLEIATPGLLDTLRAAFAARDEATLASHGRFLEPFSQHILGRDLPAAERARILAALATVARAAQAPAAGACKTATLSDN